MCGRYALSLRPREVRQQLHDAHMPVEEAPEDDDVRQSYNFAPGYYGLVYRAETPDFGGGARPAAGDAHGDNDGQQSEQVQHATDESSRGDYGTKEVHYKLQAMKWGLVPFWTKRSPEYGSVLKTINCRDDSLYEDRGMWTTMKRRKRCIILAQGFYEWLKKNNGREKIPHFVKRRDGQLMCFAGLWDCVKYEGSEEKLYTYTIITTDSSKRLSFLHDRMPVILENGSEAVRTWLDPNRSEWSKDLQGLLKPYQGELEIYPVTKDVGKVGNNSPTFIIPLDSKDNKNNIANFFSNQKKAVTSDEVKKEIDEVKEDLHENGERVKHVAGEDRRTVDDDDSTEDNAPKPALSERASSPGTHSPRPTAASGSPPGRLKRELSDISPSRATPNKLPASKKIRSSTSNGTMARSPAKAGDGSNQKITAFFGK